MDVQGALKEDVRRSCHSPNVNCVSSGPAAFSKEDSVTPSNLTPLLTGKIGINSASITD